MADFIATDASEQDGNRLELYEFIAGGAVYRYCNGQRAMEYNGFTWIAEQVERGSAKLNQDKLRNSTTFSLPISNAFAQSFIGQAVEADVYVRAIQIHLGADGERVAWTGRITSAKANEKTVEFECKSSLSVLARPGLRSKFERGCRRTLYKGGCNVFRGDFQETVSGSVESGAQITNNAFANKVDGWFAGGVAINAAGESRMIVEHTGSLITLSRPFVTSANGGDLTVAPGCDKSLTTCRDKFSNEENFGGLWYMPTKNPFEGLS